MSGVRAIRPQPFIYRLISEKIEEHYDQGSKELEALIGRELKADHFGSIRFTVLTPFFGATCII